MTDYGRKRSYFDGGLLGLVGINILTFVLSIFTFGIAFPWLYCIRLSWTANHTVIDGKRLMFTGTGGGLILNWIKWIFLTFITFGIYSFWLVIKLKQWEVEHTVFDENFTY